MRRGQVREKLFVNFWKPYYRKNELAIDHSHYPVTTIGQLVIKRAGLKDGPGGWLISASEYTEDGVPIVRAMNVSEEGKIAGDFVYISEDKHADLSATEILPSDLLLTMRGSIGRSAIVPDTIPTANINAAICRIRLQDKTLNEFIRDYLNCPLGQLQSERHGHKAVQGDLNLDAIRGFRVVLPPKDIRDSLVAALEDGRSRYHAQIAQADALLNGIDDLVLTELGFDAPKKDGRFVFAVRLGELKTRCDVPYHLPKYKAVLKSMGKSKYPATCLGELSASITGGATPLRADSAQYTEDGIRFLRIQNITPYGVDLANTKHITPEVHQGELARSQLQAGDVLMTITGRIGTSAVVGHEHLPANINQHIVRIRLAAANVLPEFLASFLNSSMGTALSNRGVTGTTRIALDYETIRTIPVPVPPLPLQRKVVADVAQRYADADKIRAEAAALWSKALEDFESKLLAQGAKA